MSTCTTRSTGSSCCWAPAAEKALSERQEELESLQSRRALLADQMELSTLSVRLVPFGVAPPGGPDGFLDGLATGWRAW